jgi:hypothetical protein
MELVMRRDGLLPVAGLLGLTIAVFGVVMVFAIG